MTPVKYHEAAEDELLHEIGYLELRANGLGRRFYAEVQRAEKIISQFQNRLRSADRGSGDAYSGSQQQHLITNSNPIASHPYSLFVQIPMKLKPEELEKISTVTLEHYDQHAEDFWEGTKDHDVSQNIEALFRYIEGEPPFTILDFGCGPGRDLKTFSDLGHIAIGLEGSSRLAEMARAYSGCEVWEQDFLKLDLPPGRFDGVFANASLFHVPSQELPRVLGDLCAALKPRGVLFSSNPRGDNEEGWQGQRYGAYHDLETWRGYMSAAGFVELAHYYRPTGLPREKQPWLASVWRKSGL